jgi:hypothetical protein
MVDQGKEVGRQKPAAGSAEIRRQERLTARAEVSPSGEFEILAISAGDGNGWIFPAEVLRASLSLWEGTQCFIDHGADGPGRSVRDLAGVLHAVEWDAEREGVRCRLRAFGPSAELLTDLGRQLMGVNIPIPRIGFSADVLFTAQDRRVTRIVRVLSVDLVLNPARGGTFLRAIQSQRGEQSMDATNPQDGKPTTAAARTTAEDQAARALLQTQREQLCGYLLESALGAARLPQAAAELVRKQLAGKVFEPAEMNAAIDSARALAAELTAGAVVQGGGRISAMTSSEDQLEAAVDDLFGVPRSAELKNVKAARLSGIRELYLTTTGDDDLHGGYYPQRVRLATTLDFTGLVKNALNKVVADRWQELGRAGYEWWRRVVTVEHCTSLNEITGILVGTVGDLPAVLEGAPYTELAVGDSAETAAFVKYGGYIPLTLELIDRDETRKLREYPRQLAAAGLRKISTLVASVFTANLGVGPNLSDGGALFNTDAVTIPGGHANLRAVALSAMEWDAVGTRMYEQPMLVKNVPPQLGVGPMMAVNPRYLLVPRALQLTAMKILYPSLENAVDVYSENMQRGQPGDVVTVPEWTDANDWAAVCDPLVAPAVYVGERFGLMPEIFIAGGEHAPAVFTNDEHRLKVRHFLAVFVGDYRPLHKSNVAG